MKKIMLISLLIISMVMLQGCWLMFDFICPALGEDSAHCVQWMAVQDENPDGCKGIEQKAEFKQYGSNPPKDKCYLMIAENSGDTSACDNIEGGMMSYTVEECYMNAADKHKDADLCDGSPQEDYCRVEIAKRTGSCGKDYEFNKGSYKCIKSEKSDKDSDDKDDSDCAKDEIYEKCVSATRLKMCDQGEVSYKECSSGCFEAACRTDKGETDIPYETTEDDSAHDSESADTDKTEDADKDSDKDDEKEDDEEEEEEEEEFECEDEFDCLLEEDCVMGKCVEKQGCKDDIDCDIFQECTKGKCVDLPECEKGTEYCGSSLNLVVCENEKLVKKTCKFGCKEDHCMTQEEKEKEDEKQEDEEKCDDGDAKCVSENTIELCKNEEWFTGLCEFGCEKGACKPEVECPWYNPWCDKEGDSDVIEVSKAAGGKYMEALDLEIEKEKDPAKLQGLKKYKEFLEKAGNSLDAAETTYNDLMKIKRVFIDSYDPSMDVENMDVGDILKKGFFEKVGDSVDKLKFWKGPKTDFEKEEDMANEQLEVYKAMLERQKEIDFLKKSRKDRLVDTIVDSAKEKAVEELTGKATELAEDIAGPAFITVGIAGKAIQSVQDEAERMMFTGLIKAYNRRREQLERDFPDADAEALHKMTIEQVEQDPYTDDKKFTRIAQYGNLIENKDCKDSDNPLCIDRNVFWTSMKKSYNHLNQKRLFDREMDQLDKKIQKSKLNS